MVQRGSAKASVGLVCFSVPRLPGAKALAMDVADPWKRQHRLRPPQARAESSPLLEIYTWVRGLDFRLVALCALFVFWVSLGFL